MMNDSKQFSISSARLDALRKHLPSVIDESEVRDYHSIVDALELASGEVLKDFRVPEDEMKPKIISAQRASYNGRPGHVAYSDKKYCDHGYFNRQVEGLWQYIQGLHTGEGSHTKMHKDYWSMSDRDLEQLALRYNIPSVSRTGKSSEHWFIDRERIISALTKRDKALEGGVTKNHTSNVLNVEHMYGSAVQQGTHGSNATVNFKANENEMRELFAKINSSLDLLGLSPEHKAQLHVDVETINVQLSAANPKSSVISECLHSVKNILEHAAGHALALTFLSHISSLGI